MLLSPGKKPGLGPHCPHSHQSRGYETMTESLCVSEMTPSHPSPQTALPVANTHVASVQEPHLGTTPVGNQQAEEDSTRAKDGEYYQDLPLVLRLNIKQGVDRPVGSGRSRLGAPSRRHCLWLEGAYREEGGDGCMDG